MKNVDPGCPYCARQMTVTGMSCARCGVSIEGEFELPRVGRLPSEDAAFLAEYVLANYSIKELEKRIGLSYPAIRARLDRVLESLQALSAGEAQRRSIIERVERGELKADDAIRLIEALKKGSKK